MTRSDDALHALLQEWAAHESATQVTPLTAAMLKCKHRLALEDARKARLDALRRLFMGVSGVLAAVLFLHLGSPVRALEQLVSLHSSALGSLFALLALAALIAPALASDR